MNGIIWMIRVMMGGLTTTMILHLCRRKKKQKCLWKQEKDTKEGRDKKEGEKASQEITNTETKF